MELHNVPSIIVLLLGAALCRRFVRCGGIPTLKAMGGHLAPRATTVTITAPGAGHAP